MHDMVIKLPYTLDYVIGTALINYSEYLDIDDQLIYIFFSEEISEW